MAKIDWWQDPHEHYQVIVPDIGEANYCPPKEIRIRYRLHNLTEDDDYKLMYMAPDLSEPNAFKYVLRFRIPKRTDSVTHRPLGMSAIFTKLGDE